MKLATAIRPAVRGMHEQREQVEAALRVMEDWARELRNVDRTKLGVPYIRDVKQVLGDLSRGKTQRDGRTM